MFDRVPGNGQGGGPAYSRVWYSEDNRRVSTIISQTMRGRLGIPTRLSYPILSYLIYLPKLQHLIQYN